MLNSAQADEIGTRFRVRLTIAGTVGVFRKGTSACVKFLKIKCFRSGGDGTVASCASASRAGSDRSAQGLASASKPRFDWPPKAAGPSVAL